MYSLVREEGEFLLKREMDIKSGKIEATLGNLFEFDKTLFPVKSNTVLHVAYNDSYALSLHIKSEKDGTITIGYYPYSINENIDTKDHLVNMMIRAGIIENVDKYNYAISFTPEVYAML